MKHSLKILIVSTMISTSSIPFTASAMKNNNNSTNIKNLNNEIITKEITNQLKEFENCVKKYEQKINNLNSKITNFKENKISDKLETIENYSELSERYKELKKLIEKLKKYHNSNNNDNNKKEKSEKELENDLKKVKETIETLGFNSEKMIQRKLEEMREFEKKEINKENDDNKNRELKNMGIKLYVNIIKNLENIKKSYDEIKNLYNSRMKCLSNYNNMNKSHLYTKKQSINEIYNIPKNSAYNAYYNLKQGEVPRKINNMYYVPQKNLYNNNLYNNANISKENNSKINEKLDYPKSIVYSTNLYPEKLQNNQKLKGILKNSQNKKINNLSQHSNTNLVIKETKSLYDCNDMNKSHLYTKKKPTNELFNIPKSSGFYAFYNLKQKEEPRKINNIYYVPQKNLYNNNLYNNANISKENNSKINEKLDYPKSIVYSTNLYPEKLQNNQKLKGILKNSQNKKINNLSQHSNTNLVIKETKSLYNYNDINKSHLYTKKQPMNEIYNIPKNSAYYILKQREEPRKINNIYYVQQKNLYNNANINKENNSKINERKILNKSVKFNEEKEKNKILEHYKEEDLDKKIKEIKRQITENNLSSRYNMSLMYCEPTKLKKMLKKSQKLKEEILSLNVHKKLDKISKEMRSKVSKAVRDIAVRDIYKNNLNTESKNSLSIKTQEETQEYLKKEKYEDLKELKDIYDNLEIFEKYVSKEIEKQEKYKETYQNRYEKKKNYIFNRNIQQYPIQTNNVHISQQRNIQQNNNIKHDMKNNYQIKNLLNSVYLEKSLYNNNDNNLKNEKMRDIILIFKNIKNKDLFNNHKRQQSF